MRSTLTAALFNPLNVAMLGLSVAAGLCAAWWLLPVGLLLWLVMVATAARDPALHLSQTLKRRLVLAARFQGYFDQIERAQVGIFNAVAASDPRTQQALQPVQVQLNAVVDQVYNLCQRMTALENHRLVTNFNQDLGKSLAGVDQQIASATDAVVRQKYEESRRALQAQAASLQALSTQMERMEAQLSSVAHEIDVMLAEVVSLQALDPEQAVKQTRELLDKLQRQKEELKLFESITEELKPIDRAIAEASR
jgi:hypothetical protein